ncbi:MAG: zinc-dependent metalloprotease family protein [Ignavibacteria bacterium]
MKNILTFLLLAAFIGGVPVILNNNNLQAQNTDQIWSVTAEGNFAVKGERRIIPSKYNTVNTNIEQLTAQLRNAPFELSDRAQNSPYVIELPMPNGQYSKFYLTEYSMMEPGLAMQFPDMRTYNVKGMDDPYAVGKLDITMHGFHAMVLTPMGDYYIDPYSSDEREVYISYYKSDFLPSKENKFECLVNEEILYPDLGGSNMVMTGQQLRTYRLACAADGEYTAFFGGTVPAGQAAVVTAINRVNGIYERDMSVRMTLVANNMNIVFTNSATDPYNNNDGNAMLGQNQTTCDNAAFIGSGNYDVGHVFSTGGGGVAGLGVVCLAGNKARGVTGLPSPVGDPFYIDYVAHEMGHQFGGNHTFNSTTSNCGFGNRNGSTAWEPGSGSTIMPYAGICGADDLQPHSDDYFHSGSVTEITNYTQTGGGSSCPVTTSTGNTPPVVTVPAGGFTIPVSTPFALTGSATDGETPGSLTYCWEEFDVGPAGSPNSPSGNAPIFRSFSPVTSPTRTFPKTSDLLNNGHTLGELLPTYTRSLSFRLTARDNSAGGGGISFGSVAFNVNSGAGPFLVTSPNTAISWDNGTSQNVTWNVANSNAAPVNCANVNIKLSTDGGLTFPITLASNTPNDGSESITVPSINTTTARIKVEASGNIFFDISNTNFTIVISSVAPSTFTLIPQGFYNTITNQLNIRDTVKVYLRNSSIPYALVDSGKVVIDSTGFTGTVTFNNASTGNYYIVLKHRNTLETWSRFGGEAYTRGVPFSYDFTTAANKAYGNNMVQVNPSPVRFGIYSGDVNGNGLINLGDLVAISNNVILFANGYLKTDINGNNISDLSDLIITYNNSTLFITQITP